MVNTTDTEVQRIGRRDAAILDYAKHLATLLSAGLAFAATLAAKKEMNADLLRGGIVALALGLLCAVGGGAVSLKWFNNLLPPKRGKPETGTFFVLCLLASGILLWAGLVLITFAATKS